MPDDHKFKTLAIRAGHNRSSEREHSEAIFATSSFVFDSALHAASVFKGDVEGNIYSRFSNPTVQTFEKRVAALEGGNRAVATASGMAAILTICMAVLKSGDHIVVSRDVFGPITIWFEKYLSKFGIEVDTVPLTDISVWEQSIKPNTKMFFLETPTNPLTYVVDIKEMAGLAHVHNIILVVDNAYCTPALQKPLSLGADVVVHSATKYLDGQGRAVGGVVIGNNTEIMDEVYGFVRTAGPSMSPFNAWIFLKGLETLYLRMQAHVANATELALWLESQDAVTRVCYPGLQSHPQYEVVKHQQNGGGGILSFELKGGKEAAWKLMDSAKMVAISANFGDTKTIFAHSASTTHGRLTPEQRKEAGISDGLVRVSVGLEDIDDIKNDFRF